MIGRHATVPSKWRSAAPLPPDPSQCFRPEPMLPVDRLSQRFSVTPDSSHFQSFGFGLIFLFSDGSCSSDRAYLLSLDSKSSTKAATLSVSATPLCPMIAWHTCSRDGGGKEFFGVEESLREREQADGQYQGVRSWFGVHHRAPHAVGMDDDESGGQVCDQDRPAKRGGEGGAWDRNNRLTLETMVGMSWFGSGTWMLPGMMSSACSFSTFVVVAPITSCPATAAALPASISSSVLGLTRHGHNIA